MRVLLSRLCLATVLGACASCTPQGNDATASSAKSASLLGAVATVNGTVISEAELQLALKANSHGAEPDRRKMAIAALIHEELQRQKALELGLEPEGGPADEVARLETLLTVARRRALADAWFRAQVVKKAEPTEQEARQFFEANAPQIRTEYHLAQIFLRDEAQILQAQQDLQRGVAFEDVARRQFPGLPDAAGLPWELGFLNWKQLPEAWRPVLEALKPGETSTVIRGPGGRFWILKLVERRSRPELTFDEVRPLIIEDLKRARLEQLTVQSDQELRKSARITEP